MKEDFLLNLSLLEIEGVDDAVDVTNTLTDGDLLSSPSGITDGEHANSKFQSDFVVPNNGVNSPNVIRHLNSIGMIIRNTVLSVQVVTRVVTYYGSSTTSS